MKIFSCSVDKSCSDSKQQNFSGIVEERPVAEYGGRTNRTVWQSYYYYPFADENPDEFVKLAKNRNKDQVFPVSVDYPEWGNVRKVVKYIKKDVLPFTKTQWDVYCKNPNVLSDNIRQVIEKSIKKLKL